jgi:hypothetical protein
MGMMKLNSLIDLPQGVILMRAMDINNKGQVTAWGLIPEPETYALMVPRLGMVGFAARREGGRHGWAKSLGPRAALAVSVYFCRVRDRAAPVLAAVGLATGTGRARDSILICASPLLPAQHALAYIQRQPFAAVAPGSGKAHTLVIGLLSLEGSFDRQRNDDGFVSRTNRQQLPHSRERGCERIRCCAGKHGCAARVAVGP